MSGGFGQVAQLLATVGRSMFIAAPWSAAAAAPHPAFYHRQRRCVASTRPTYFYTFSTADLLRRSPITVQPPNLSRQLLTTLKSSHVGEKSAHQGMLFALLSVELPLTMF